MTVQTPARMFLCLSVVLFLSSTALSQSQPLALYEQLKGMPLSGEVITVSNAPLNRDRVQLNLTGELHLARAIDGKVYGAYFVGQGRLRAEGWSSFEKENIRRFLKTEVVEATFTRAVLRFSDDMLAQFANAGRTNSSPEAHARAIAGHEARLLKETGLNVSARLALAIANGEKPGFFFAEFDGGDRGRFSAVVDHQSRVPSSIFGVNGGEKGLLYQHMGVMSGIDVWTGFYDEQDFKAGFVAYSDMHNLVQPVIYRMDVDLTAPNDRIGMDVEIDLKALHDGVQVIPFTINEGLDEYDNERLKKGIKLTSAQAGGQETGFAQEPWEAGFSVFLPKPLKKGEQITLKLKLEGKDYLRRWEGSYYYPLSTTTWYPRHGFLQQSRYEMTFRHPAKTLTVAPGTLGSRTEDGKTVVTKWVVEQPVKMVTFAMGRFEMHTEKFKAGTREIPVEFYSLPGHVGAVKEDFVLAELINGLNYFTILYGDYPYPQLKAVFFPAGFGQGFPGMLLLPVDGTARLREFSFIAHEGAHQWWGHKVGWRSYRDQWLSEGFAEYSGALYAASRDKPNRALELVDDMRRELTLPPGTDTGIASGKLADIGPLTLGHRVSTRRSRGAYTALAYSKGALVLRMLHFLFTNPATGDDAPFFNMMKDFVEQHKGNWATTESFFDVANKHFVNTRIAQKYSLKDLNWFYQQWVLGTPMPQYRMEYRVERGAQGAVVRGTIYQANVPEGWFMPLPLRMEFPGKQVANGTLHAFGPKTDFELPLPAVPSKVQLDPHKWVLSEKTESKGK